MVMLGKTYNSTGALQMGLVNKAVPPESLMAEARALVRELTSKPFATMKGVKVILNTGMDLDWASARRFESELCSVFQLTKDAREGFLSLVEKRKPQFKGEDLAEGIKKGLARKRGT
jgi:enoyl-CoA hydratase/carnithine racemase